MDVDTNKAIPALVATSGAPTSTSAAASTPATASRAEARGTVPRAGPPTDDVDAFTDYLENNEGGRLAADDESTRTRNESTRTMMPMNGIGENFPRGRSNGSPPGVEKVTGDDSEYKYVVVDMPMFQGTHFLNSVEKFEVRGLSNPDEEPRILVDGFPMRCQRIDTFGTNLIFDVGSVGPAIPIGMSSESIGCELDTRKIPERKIVHQ